MPMAPPAMPILVTDPAGGPPIPMMVPPGGGPLVPYAPVPLPMKPPTPILMTGPGGAPIAMMMPPGGGPLVPY